MAGKRTLSVAEAFDRIDRSVGPLGIERLDTRDALWRRTTTIVVARRDLPPFDVAAMDGFVLSAGETLNADGGKPLKFAIGAAIAAGTRVARLRPRTARPISTGAAIPSGGDCVLPWELALRRDDAAGRPILHVDQPISRLRNVRLRGEDRARGSQLLGRGDQIVPEALALLIGCGIGTVSVRRRPHIGLLATGTELARPGNRAASGQIHDTNSPMIAAMAQSAGLPLLSLGHAPDAAGAIARAIDDGSRNPDISIIATTGGVSGGDHDHVLEAVRSLGAKILFHGIAMRPGKPLLLARLPTGTLLFGLPGNPVAALIGFRFFVLRAARGYLDLPPEAGDLVEIRDLPVKSGLNLFLRARQEAGALSIDFDQRSHVLHSLIEADSWILTGENPKEGCSASRFPLRSPRLT